MYKKQQKKYPKLSPMKNSFVPNCFENVTGNEISKVTPLHFLIKTENVFRLFARMRKIGNDAKVNCYFLLCFVCSKTVKGCGIPDTKSQFHQNHRQTLRSI